MRYLFVLDSVRTFFFFFFAWPRSSQVRKFCVNSLKTADFSLATPLSQCLYLRGRSGFLEIVFVGECEVPVCLGFC